MNLAAGYQIENRRDHRPGGDTTGHEPDAGRVHLEQRDRGRLLVVDADACANAAAGGRAKRGMESLVRGGGVDRDLPPLVLAIEALDRLRAELGGEREAVGVGVDVDHLAGAERGREVDRVKADAWRPAPDD